MTFNANIVGAAAAVATTESAQHLTEAERLTAISRHLKQAALLAGGLTVAHLELRAAIAEARGYMLDLLAGGEDKS